MTNKEVAAILNSIGTLLELLEDNPFRANAYYNAARHIEGLDQNVLVLAEQQQLRTIPGIGDKLRDKIVQIAKTGRSEYLDQLKAEIPPGLMDLLKIPGLGPKRVRLLWKQLNITNLQELEYACNENRLSTLKGFGEKMQAKIIEGIRLVKRYMESFLLGEALPIAEELEAHLRRCFHVKQVSIAGSVRRGKETVRDIDLVVGTTEAQQVTEHLNSSRYVESVRLEQGLVVKTIHVRLLTGPPVDVECVPPDRFAGALFYYTGSKAYIDELNKLYQPKFLSFTSGGIFDKGKPRAFSTEAEIFAALGLQFTPPELRETTLGILQAQAGTIPTLLEPRDLTGVLHVHSTWSDGVNTIEEMAIQAKALGFKYLGLTDHSKSAGYARGLDESRLRQQWDEIARVQTKHPEVHILRGIECDILPDGSMDFPDSVLRELDFVIGSVHSGFNMSEADMTARVIKAIENPFVDIIGHPTGRLLLGREGYAIDIPKVLRAARENGKVIELNANPHRLDLDWTWLRKAAEMGVMVSIGPDAHNRNALADVRYGVLAARRGGLVREHVLNARPPAEVIAFFKRRR